MVPADTRMAPATFIATFTTDNEGAAPQVGSSHKKELSFLFFSKKGCIFSADVNSQEQASGERTANNRKRTACSGEQEISRSQEGQMYDQEKDPRNWQLCQHSGREREVSSGGEEPNSDHQCPRLGRNQLCWKG